MSCACCRRRCLLPAELLLDVEAEGHGACVFLAALGMEEAKGHELLTPAPPIGLALAALAVCTARRTLWGWLRAGGITALAGMPPELGAALGGPEAPPGAASAASSSRPSPRFTISWVRPFVLQQLMPRS